MAKSWSGMRKYLEDECLCEPLKGRVQYFITRYKKSHDEEDRVAIRIDGHEILKTSWYQTSRQMDAVRTRDTGRQEDESNRDYWHRIGISTYNAGEFDRFAFYAAFDTFQNSSIEASLANENPIVRMMAIFDRRVGKRRLEKLAGNIEEQPAWLRQLIILRLDAEKILMANYP